MKDKGILMKLDMAQAAAEGRKTKTRRLIKLPRLSPGLTWHYDTVIAVHPETGRALDVNDHWFAAKDIKGKVYRYFQAKCPYAKGQRLYLKETHYRYGKWLPLYGATTKAGRQRWQFDPDPTHVPQVVYVDDPFDAIILPDCCRGAGVNSEGWHKRSKLFMPKKFARKWYTVTEDPAPERLQDISEADAIAEGLTEFFWDNESAQIPHVAADIAAGKRWWKHVIMKRGRKGTVWDSPIKAFRELWNDIHGPDAWDRNDWLWPVTFRKD